MPKKPTKKKEIDFFVWLRSGLRSLSRKWPAIYEALAAAKVPYKGDNKRRKFSYVCAVCATECESKSVSVDHIQPCGTLTNKEDIANFVERLFCPASGLQVLCDVCHSEKTYMERYGVSLEEAQMSIAVAKIMKDKKKCLAMLQEAGYNQASNDEKRKAALREILSNKQEK